MTRAPADEAATSDYVQLAVFVVGNSSYALDIMRVREILRITPIVSVHEAPSYIQGVITLRGAYIPVVSMRKRLGLAEQNLASARILVTMARGRSFGLLIDSMTEVVRVPRTSLQQSPMPDSTAQNALIAGLCDVRGRALQLLNLSVLLQAVAHDAVFTPLVPP
jgi:purine-binding chemotaxis protein CheW